MVFFFLVSRVFFIFLSAESYFGRKRSHCPEGKVDQQQSTRHERHDHGHASEQSRRVHRGSKQNSRRTRTFGQRKRGKNSYIRAACPRTKMLGVFWKSAIPARPRTPRRHGAFRRLRVMWWQFITRNQTRAFIAPNKKQNCIIIITRIQ